MMYASLVQLDLEVDFELGRKQKFGEKNILLSEAGAKPDKWIKVCH